jgi:uncharacterized protein YciI
MFIILLKFSSNKSKAGELMAAHNEWVSQGIAEGVFLLVGSLEPRAGGAVLAHGTTRANLEDRVRKDPFVANDVVSAEVLEVSCSKSEPLLAFLLS